MDLFKHNTGSDRHSFATVDVRSEAEFKQGHIPGAINIPLLGDTERARVGLEYKKHGQVAAVQLGLNFMRHRSDLFLKQLVENAPSGIVALYCSRGGLRSSSVAGLMANLGFRVLVQEKGYKRFRRSVHEALEGLSKSRILVVNGRTGSGKTDFLKNLKSYLPTIDLEQYAMHRGSAFGDFGIFKRQTQQQFENELAFTFTMNGRPKTLLTEMENFIGPVSVPPALRAAMKESAHLVLCRDFEDRVNRLIREYADSWDENTAKLFIDRLDLFKRHLSSPTLANLAMAAQRGRLRFIARTLLKLRYDRLYDRSMLKLSPNIVAWYNISRGLSSAEGFAESYLKRGGL